MRERWVARKHRGRSTRVAVRRRALSPLPRPPRAAKSWRSCQHGLSSVVRAAQPAAQADAAARPTDAGHFGARSRHERDTSV